MGPELPDLEQQSVTPAQGLAEQGARLFRIILFGLAVLVPLLLVSMSIMTGLRIWLTLPYLLCTYAGLGAVVLGWRRDSRRLVNRGVVGVAVSFAACMVTLALLR